MKANRFETSARSAFTLVELMVTVAILIIVIAVVLKLVSGVSEKAKVTKTQSEIKLLSDAVEAFKQSTGYYPLSVPYDAWGNWNIFVATVGWATRWKDYFYDSTSDTNTYPDYNWSTYPTNIHMLTFQLIQTDESNSVIDKIKQNNKIKEQKSFGIVSMKENWKKESNACQIVHPLDHQLRIVYQPQDAWGTPLRYWSGKIRDWARDRNWDNNIQTLISDKLQENNWGFFIESAGPDEHFGWWGNSSSVSYVEQQTHDNIY